MEDVIAPDKASLDGSVGQLRVGTTRAAFASGTSQLVTRLLTIVLSVATARALEPSEVGLLGIAVIVIAIISMICYYPEIAAIAANRDERHERYALASLGIRAGLLAVVFLVVGLIFPRLGIVITGKEELSKPLWQILIILGWVPILELLAAYPRVLFQRRVDLNVIATAGVIQPTVFVLLAVLLLVNGYGYIGVAWASVIGTLASTLFFWIQLVRRGSLRWFGLPSAATLRETAVGSIRVFVGGFAGFLGERVDNLLVSSAIGPGGMSFYSMAWNGSRTPANIFGSTIGFVLIPTLARIQNEPARVGRAIRESLRHSYLLLLPLCAAMFVSAPSLVTIVLGPKWLPLVSCFRIMCVTVLTIPVLFAAGSLLTGTGRAHYAGWAMLLHLLILFVAVPPLATGFGIVGAAFGDLLAMSAATTVLILTARRVTGQTDWALPTTLFAPGLASLASGALAKLVGSEITGAIARSSAEIGVLALGYVLMLLAFGGKARLSELAGLLRSIAPRFLRSSRRAASTDHQSTADMTLERVEVSS